MPFHRRLTQIAPVQAEIGEHLAEQTGPTLFPSILHYRKTVAVIERIVASLSVGPVEPHRDTAGRTQRFDRRTNSPAVMRRGSVRSVRASMAHLMAPPPSEIVPPLLDVVSRDADTVNGWRLDSNLWDTSLHPQPG
jgi:hypothetical protein